MASPALCPKMPSASCPDLSPADTLRERSGRGFSGEKPSGHIRAIANG
ncbi:MAG: hypothetical protein KME49_05560 [Brasilonema octagenarum HA4186-MV1]|nr:hypothetical protein [Brasilonema octagenarum]MBW4624976.1 hypothetical protein [Brasilonema octagenarum HA4186-MV1]